MTTYLLLFRNASAEEGYLTTSDEMARDMPKWQAWIGQIAAQGKLLHTAPVRYDGTIVDSQGAKNGPHKEPNSVMISGFVICKSETLEEVQEWSKNCPILQYPHSAVEIRPLLPFPIH